MVEIILWSIAVISGTAAGYGLGWWRGRKRLRASQRECSTAERFLKLLNY